MSEQAGADFEALVDQLIASAFGDGYYSTLDGRTSEETGRLRAAVLQAAPADMTAHEAAAIEARDLAWVQRNIAEDRLRDAEKVIHEMAREALEVAAALNEARRTDADAGRGRS